MDLRNVAINLARLESENEVITLLKTKGLWDNKDYWKPFGDNENNFSTIGNQQSSPDSAFVEKLINSVDAILMKECQIRGINPESKDAPANIKEALTKFFNIRDGKLSNLDTRDRNKMSNDIIVSATGTKQNPNYTIVDSGEGQTPQKMPDTILSLGKSNKLRVPFVQGKFNMGGTGVFQFCGKHNIQLIITKRCPEINEENDESRDNYGITIVRREDPSEGRRSSMYTYLANIDGTIMQFASQPISIVPTGEGNYDDFEYGMFIKMFNYSMPSGMKTNIVFDLNYKLALLMPGLAHPIRLIECRDYRGHTLKTTLSGLSVRLDDDKRDNIEPEFPTSFKFSINQQSFSASIYVFKEGQDEKYRNSEGVIFTLNGQTHGSLNKTFFKRDSVGLSYVADSLLIIVDCSSIDGRTREDLFMNSRDRLRNGDIKKEIEKSLEEVLKNHQGLKALQEERRRKALENKLQDQKPLADVLKNILKKSPTLATLFLEGSKLKNPFNLSETNEAKNFKGKKYPTYFVLKHKPNDTEFIKHAPINHKFRIQFETDADNDYFNREVDQGTFELFCNDSACSEGYTLNLFNGIVTLSVALYNGVRVGDKINYAVKVADPCTLREFTETFAVIVEQPEDYSGRTGGGSRHKPSDGSDHGTREKPSGLALPNIIEIRKDEWERYQLSKEDALFVRKNSNGYDFYINMDNIHLKTELKGTRNSEKITVINARYKFSMALLALSIINHFKQNPTDDDDFSLEDEIKNMTLMISPVVLPMIDSLGDLDVDEIQYLNEETA